MTLFQLDDLDGIQARAREVAAAYDDPDLQSFVATVALTGGFTAWGNRKTTEGWPYHCYEELCLTYGTVAKAELFAPDELGTFPVSQCFANAHDLAIGHPELTYCEGYALLQTIPVQHAWVVDPDGRIIDPTWANIDTDLGDGEAIEFEFIPPRYCGIRFDTTYLLNDTTRSGWASVLASDWRLDCFHLRRGFITDDTGLVIGDLPDLTRSTA